MYDRRIRTPITFWCQWNHYIRIIQQRIDSAIAFGSRALTTSPFSRRFEIIAIIKEISGLIQISMIGDQDN